MLAVVVVEFQIFSSFVLDFGSFKTRFDKRRKNNKNHIATSIDMCEYKHHILTSFASNNNNNCSSSSTTHTMVQHAKPQKSYSENNAMNNKTIVFHLALAGTHTHTMHDRVKCIRNVHTGKSLKLLNQSEFFQESIFCCCSKWLLSDPSRNGLNRMRKPTRMDEYLYINFDALAMLYGKKSFHSQHAFFYSVHFNIIANVVCNLQGFLIITLPRPQWCSSVRIKEPRNDEHAHMCAHMRVHRHTI